MPLEQSYNEMLAEDRTVRYVLGFLILAPILIILVSTECSWHDCCWNECMWENLLCREACYMWLAKDQRSADHWDDLGR